MAEGERLAALCHAHTVPELARSVFPGSETKEIVDFQRLLVHGLVSEMSDLVAHASGRAAHLLHWLLVRFQVENLKVLMRTRSSGRARTDPRAYLVSLPRELALDVPGLSNAESADQFDRLSPKGLVREALRKTVRVYGDRPDPFFFETVLDREYLQGLLAYVDEFRERDRSHFRPMYRQEVDIFHLMVVLRARFHYGLDQEALLPLHIAGARIPRELFARMLKDQDARTAVGRVAAHVFDAPPLEELSNGRPSATSVDAGALERLAWSRFARLANLAFRTSHVGLGAVLGYAGLRRVEVANLITLSEGIRKGMQPEAIRIRLIACHREAARV